jgi:hypothetical protein
MPGNGRVRFGGRPRRKRTHHQWAPRRAADPTQSGKELAGLDEHQVRRWRSWHRWTVLAMLAHAFLSVMTATQPAVDDSGELIRLTRNEIRRLFTAATAVIRTAEHTLKWSIWRRRHQARARASHYRRQAADTS